MIPPVKRLKIAYFKNVQTRDHVSFRITNVVYLDATKFQADEIGIMRIWNGGHLLAIFAPGEWQRVSEVESEKYDHINE